MRELFFSIFNAQKKFQFLHPKILNLTSPEDQNFCQQNYFLFSLFSADRNESTDTFKKPRPVQPSPVQRSGSTSKPPPSPSGLGVLDLLDSIMQKQDRTMQDLNKSEEQKANERQRLEIERRRKSAENPFEKAAAMSRGKFS
jgi:hypothetical protein